MSTRSYLWYIKRSNKRCIVPCNNRAVTKFLSCWVYAASRWETEQPKSYLCFILLIFRLKVARVMLIVAGGNLLPLALCDSAE